MVSSSFADLNFAGIHILKNMLKVVYPVDQVPGP